MSYKLHYEFKTLSSDRVDWINQQVIAEEKARIVGGESKYKVPPMPLQFENWTDEDAQYEARMLSQDTEGENYDKFLKQSRKGSLHCKPTQAIYTDKLPDGAYFWSDKRPVQITEGSVEGPTWMRMYPDWWEYGTREKRKGWVMRYLEQTAWDDDGNPVPAKRKELPEEISFERVAQKRPPPVTKRQAPAKRRRALRK